ncbi:MAG: sodium:solute symporter family protein [Candidatus Amoebophilus sp.]
MNYFSTDAIIVYSFLFVTLAVGLWAGRNIKSLKEYAIANKNYGTGILTMTMLATYLTGSQTIGYAGHVFDNGVFFPFITRVFCGVIICFLFIARYIAPKMYRFTGCLTLAEMMGRLYGSKARIWIGILGTLYSLIMVTLQIIWLGYIGNFIDIPSQWSIFLGGVFLMFYASRGGMKAVAITDVLQFVAITILIPLAANVLLHRFDGVRDIFTHIPSENFNFFQHLNVNEFLIPFLWYLFPAFPLSFPFMQRMLMAKDTRQIANSHYIAIFYLIGFYLLLTFIGLAAIALKTMGDVNMPQQGSKVFIYLVKSYFPVGIKGIVGIGLLAAVMSTADSFLHSAGMLVAHDVIEPLLQARKNRINVLKTSQYATLILGLIAFCIALSSQSLPRILYGDIHWGKGINMFRDFVAIVFTIPMIAGIMGLKTDARPFFISLIATCITFFIGKFLLSDLWFMPVTIIINAASFFGAHYIQNKGFLTVKRDKILVS